MVISAQLTAFVNGLIQQGAAGQIFNPQTQSPFTPLLPPSSPPAINSARCVHSTCTLSPCSSNHVHMGSPYHGTEANNNTDVSCPSEDKVYFLDSGGHAKEVGPHCYKNKIMYKYKCGLDSCAKRFNVYKNKSSTPSVKACISQFSKFPVKHRHSLRRVSHR